MAAEPGLFGGRPLGLHARTRSLLLVNSNRQNPQEDNSSAPRAASRHRGAEWVGPGSFEPRLEEAYLCLHPAHRYGHQGAASPRGHHCLRKQEALSSRGRCLSPCSLGQRRRGRVGGGKARSEVRGRSGLSSDTLE